MYLEPLCIAVAAASVMIDEDATGDSLHKKHDDKSSKRSYYYSLPPIKKRRPPPDVKLLWSYDCWGRVFRARRPQTWAAT